MKFTTAVFGLVLLTICLPAFSADHAGKEVYDQSCKNCHGPDGAGNNVADKFFGITIPRLNSKSVQMKTDSELQEIILRGSGRMEPVRIGRPTMPHGKTKTLTEQQIDDVVAYVRTFWKQ